MPKNFNDKLEMRLFNTYFYFDGINPLYGNLIYYLNQTGALKLKKDEDFRSQILAIEKVLKKEPNTFKKILQFAIEDGFTEDLSARYRFSNNLYRKCDEDSYLSIIKFKIINNKLYMYDLTIGPENRKYLEVTDINGVNTQEIINVFKIDNFTNEQIESLIQHKEILSAYGFEFDKFEIKISDVDKCIRLDDPEIRLDFDIFYKQHVKSKLLDKSNFNLSVSNSTKKTNISYGYDSNLKLIAMLHGLCKSKEDLGMFENIHRLNTEVVGYSEANDTNIDWMFISSFFLMNKEEKNDLPDYVYSDLERKLSLTMHGGPWCIFLDENNDEQSYGYNVTNDTYGCNDYIYHDGKIDTKMIFHAIRDALAHSLYEVIDKDYIRIYGYDEKNNVMNCNLKVKKDIVIEFINKISNFRSFGNLFPICTLENPNFDNRSISNPDELERYLKNIIVSDVEIKKYSDLDKLKTMQEYASYFARANNPHPEYLNDDTKLVDMLEYDYERKIQFMKFRTSNPMTRTARDIEVATERGLKVFADFEYKKIKLTLEQIEKIKQQISSISDTFYNHSAYNQHVIITELIKNELNPSRNISEIISDIIKSKDKTDGSIMDTLNEKSPKYVNYDKVIKASIIAYLNNVLLYSFNGNKIDCSGLDFSNMLKNLQPLIDTKQNRINGLKAENKNSRKTIAKHEKRIEVLEKKLLSEDNQCDPELTEEKTKREQEKEEATLKIDENQRIIATLEEEINSIKNNTYVDNYFVLEHLRNSLAHGNIFFSDTIDINKIGQLEITFIDYYPQKDKSKTPIESFRGTIKFSELLSCLNEEKFINSLFNQKDKTNVASKKS